MKENIKSYLEKTKATLNLLDGIIDQIYNAAEIIRDTYAAGGKIIILGNGGSAADAQHIATELVSKFRKERSTLPAVSLTTNTSMLTAISNDYDFTAVFSRQLEAIASDNDTVLAISTSGNSPNVIQAAISARDRGLKVIAMTGESGGRLGELADVLLNIPSQETSHIQEGHVAVYHALCHVIEEEIFPG